MNPDDTEVDIEHTFDRNLTSAEPAVTAPILKPPIVTVNADAVMTAPDVVILTAVAEVAPHAAVKPATLLAPEANEGTEDAKKLEGYERVKVPPERIGNDGVKPRVTEIDDLPDTLSEEEMPRVKEEISIQKCKFQRDFSVDDKTETGVYRCVVLPSPTCAKIPPRQPQMHSQRNTKQRSKMTTTSVTSPSQLRPQQETELPLDRTQECPCKPMRHIHNDILAIISRSFESSRHGTKTQKKHSVIEVTENSSIETNLTQPDDII